MENTSKVAKLPDREIFYFRQRNKNRIFQSVIACFARKAKEGLTKRQLALRLGKDAAQITRWFSGPSNWTLDTVSDLLLAMESELEDGIKPLNAPLCGTTFMRSHEVVRQPSSQFLKAEFPAVANSAR